MNTSQLTIAVLMYFVLPVWLAAGSRTICAIVPRRREGQTDRDGLTRPVCALLSEDLATIRMKAAGAFNGLPSVVTQYHANGIAELINFSIVMRGRVGCGNHRRGFRFAALYIK
jgi:hypothetical protein